MGVLAFDWVVYGNPTKTGYANGEITFSLGSIIPNLKHMPELLVRSVQAMVIAFAAVIWIVVRLIRSRFSSVSSPQRADRARRDALIGGFLALGWLGIWGLYLAYDWTVQGGAGHGGLGKLPNGAIPPFTGTMPAFGGSMPAFAGPPGGGGGGSIHLVRFYVPAIGLIALLATWFVMQLPRWLAPVLPILAVVTAYGSFHTLTAEGGMRAPFGAPGAAGAGLLPFDLPGQGGRPGYGPPGLQNGTMPDGLPPGDGMGRPRAQSSGTPPRPGGGMPGSRSGAN
jgi:hypothetical protein